MPLPTLLIKGKLVPPDPSIQQADLNDWIPIEYIIDWFKTRQNQTGIHNRVLILKSETASGKSTAMPAEVYKNLVSEEVGRGIICTQPRVLTAIENVTEILKNYSDVLRRGETIGWSTKHNKLRPRNYGLLSATIGTLTQQLQSLTDEELIAKYKFILIDETHERDLQTDMTLYMLKNFLQRNADNINCPFVALMSATFDPGSFLKYFSLEAKSNFIWCRGETAGFDEVWDWNEERTVNDYPRAAAEVVRRIVTENPDDDPLQADILIFMPGKAEFKQTNHWLQVLNEELVSANKNVFSVLQIESVAIQTQNLDYKKLVQIPTEDHIVRIKDRDYTPRRRVIITTNVAETGLTLDNLKYVIDSGFNKEIEYNPIVNIRALLTKPAPKSRITQRRGRAGRKFRGVFYPLYPQYIYNKLHDLQFPQILVEDISPIALSIINEQLRVKTLMGKTPTFSITDIDMIDQPTPDALHGCLEKLYSLGFISPIAPKWDPNPTVIMENEPEQLFGITKLGILANNFSMIAPETIRMILAAYSWECSVMDIISIAAYLQISQISLVDNVAETTKQIEIDWKYLYKEGLPDYFTSVGIFHKTRLIIADNFIDGIVLYNAIYNVMKDNKPSVLIKNLKKWCEKHKLSYTTIIEFLRVREEIIEQMVLAGLDVHAHSSESVRESTFNTLMTIVTKIKYCIYDGFRNNILTRRDDNNYYTSNGIEVTRPSIFREYEKINPDEDYKFVLDLLPTTVIYRELNMKFDIKTSTYSVIASQISTLDGFVSWDTGFLS